jgi:HAD superfamily phosphoserine phosphatase-like hydrolase
MWTVVADFDGTIVKWDLAERTLRKFGRPGWEHFDDLLRADEINVQECITRQYAMIAASSRTEIADYIDQFCEFRPGFDVLLNECRDRGIDFTIVSAGLDFCIKHAFRKAGIELPRLICPKSTFTPNEGFRLVFPQPHLPASKDFKEDFVTYRQLQGYDVIYIGDGMGDFYGAAKADRVFAIKGSTLDKVCMDRKIPRESIETFDPVKKFVTLIRNQEKMKRQ